MTFLYYTLNNKNLFNSLTRYFKQILNSQLIPLSKSNNSVDNCILLVHFDERENPKLLDVLSRNNSIKFILIGHDNRSTIDLIDLSKIKKKILNAINQVDKNRGFLFTKAELKEKLKNFFHSHGEESIISDLNFIHYAVSNYSLYVYDEIDYENYYSSFLIPAIKRFSSIEAKLVRFSPFIVMSGFGEELSVLIEKFPELKTFFKSIDTDLLRQKNAESVKNIELILASLSEINDILNKIFNKL